MARDISTNQDLTVSAAPSTGYGTSMACWFNQDASHIGTLMCIGEAGVQNWLRLVLVNSKLWANQESGGQAQSTGSTTNGVWHHGGGVWAGGNDYRVFLDGSKDTAAPNDVEISNQDQVVIGSDTTDLQRFNGKIAECAIWDTNLTDAEFSTLAAGYSPLFVRPANLVFYAPLMGASSPEPELMQGNALTLNNAPVKSPHPRVIYPAKPQIIVPAAAAGPAGDVRPPFHHHRHHNRAA